MRVRRFVSILCLAGVAGLAAAQAPAYDPKPSDPYGRPYPPGSPPPFPDPAARDMMIQGAQQIVRALELILMSIPTYDPPIVTPDGDIIIKRRRGPAAKPPPDPDMERTVRPVPGGTQL